MVQGLVAAAVPVAAQCCRLAAYTKKIIGAYKPRYDGKVLLRFPRLFILAVR
jgi:trans-aconitate 2-methyltransferase